MAMTPEFSSNDAALVRRLTAAHLLFGSYETAKRLAALALWLDPGSEEAQELMSRASMRR